MRRALGGLVAALLVIPAAVGRAAPADRTPGAQTDQIALTLFLRHEGHGPPTMYFGGAFAINVLEAFGFAGRAQCHRYVHDGDRGMSCHGSATGVSVLPPNYYMDPLLRTAHLEFDQHRWHHVVDWTSESVPDAYQKVKPRHSTVQLFSDATAEGKLFGKHFKKGPDGALSFLLEAAFVDAAVHGVHVTRAADGTVRVDANFPARSSGR